MKSVNGQVINIWNPNRNKSIIMSKKKVIILTILFFIVSAGLLLILKPFFSNRPYRAAICYCDCIGKAPAIKREVYCDSVIALKYKELYTYYVDKEDTTNWNEISKFYIIYIHAVDTICGEGNLTDKAMPLVHE